MKNSIVHLFVASVFGFFWVNFVPNVFAQKPEIRAVGVDESGQEVPAPFTLVVRQTPTTLLYALPTSLAFEGNLSSLPKSIALTNPKAAATYSIERLVGLGSFAPEMLYIVGKRMIQMPKETLTLFESDNVLKRSAAIREYLRDVWGIAPERVLAKVKKNIPKSCNCVELSSDSLLKPLVFIDTVPMATPPILRFYSSNPQMEENPAQWSINIRQEGQALRSPISAAGSIKPIVDWKINKEKTTIPKTNKPLKYSLEIRYPTIANQRTPPSEIPVSIEKMNIRRIEAVLPFVGAESSLNASHQALLAMIREHVGEQILSKVSVQSYGIAPVQEKEPDDAKQRGIPEDRRKAVEKALGKITQNANYRGETVIDLKAYFAGKENTIVITLEMPHP